MNIHIERTDVPSVAEVPRRSRRRSGVLATIAVASLLGGVCAASTAGADTTAGGRHRSGQTASKDLQLLAGVDGLSGTGRSRTAPSLDQDGTATIGRSRRSPASSPVRRALDDVVTSGVVGALARVYVGKSTEADAAGKADRDTARALRAGDQFEIGSNTKTMMATMVLQLVGEGRLRLSDPVEKLLPGIVPGGDKITLRMLLQHTSGLYNYTDDARLQESFLQEPTTKYSPEDLVAGAMKHPPLFEPGSRWSYSNTNYLLVGMILQRTTGQSPDRLLQERIVHPLGLRNTYLVTHLATNTGPGYAHGYLATVTGPDSAPKIHYTDVSGWSLSWAWTAGAVVSTAPDLSRFISALLGGELLPAPQLADMLRTVPLEGVDDADTAGYGLGILRMDTPCGTVWGHTGGTLGHSSHMFATIDGKRTVITDATTLSDEEEPSNSVARAMAAADENLWLTGVCSMQGKELPKTPAPSTGASLPQGPSTAEDTR
jgi:D-alanyl-D-alanine carboxypeptidase